MLRRTTLTGLVTALLLVVVASWASAMPVTQLTFEGLKDGEQILGYYNGGLGGLGTGPGPGYGITFSSDSLAIIQAAAGGGGNFEKNPSGITIAYFLSGAGDIMNVPGGFDTGFSFFYSAAVYPGSVTVYDGLNGTGNVLATLNLPVTPQLPGTTYTYSNWQPVGVNFAGTALSVNFSGTANYIGFDDITLGSSNPVVPEPASFAVWSLVGAVGIVFGWRQRRRRAG